MSNDEGFGQASVEAAHGFERMPDTAPEDEKEIYTADHESLLNAAKELTEARTAAEQDAVPRKYVRVDGAQAGEDYPERATVSPERAARDLSDLRNLEVAEVQAQHDQNLTELVDSARAAVNPQPAEQQPEAPTIEAQPDEPPVEQPTNGVDREVVEALEKNPKLRAAVEAEVQRAEEMRRAYSTATWQAAQVAAAAVLATYDELNGFTTEQLPTVIATIAKQNPQRAQDIQNHLSRVQQLYDTAQQAKAAEAQIERARFQNWVKAEDSKFEAVVKDPPEMRAKLGAEAVALLKEYGATEAEIVEAWNSPSVLRSAVGQRVLRDAAQYRLSLKEVQEKMVRAAPPPVQRPGVANGFPVVSIG